MATLRKTGLRHPLKWYVENYGLPLQTVVNAHKRDWPLDQPAKLLTRIMQSRGPRTSIDKLVAYINGERPAPKKSTTPNPRAACRITLCIDDALYGRAISKQVADTIIDLVGKDKWEIDALAEDA